MHVTDLFTSVSGSVTSVDSKYINQPGHGDSVKSDLQFIEAYNVQEFQVIRVDLFSNISVGLIT